MRRPLVKSGLLLFLLLLLLLLLCFFLFLLRRLLLLPWFGLRPSARRGRGRSNLVKPLLARQGRSKPLSV